MHISKMIVFLFLLLSAYVHAGRTGPTTIEHIVIKNTYIEVYTTNDGGCGSLPYRWYLLNTHDNFQALLSGFLATKAAGKEVDIVGNANCPDGEEIDWAFVLE